MLVKMALIASVALFGTVGTFALQPNKTEAEKASICLGWGEEVAKAVSDDIKLHADVSGTIDVYDGMNVYLHGLSCEMEQVPSTKVPASTTPIAYLEYVNDEQKVRVAYILIDLGLDEHHRHEYLGSATQLAYETKD